MAGSGAEMFARYAYAPNRLGYCGPPDAAALRDGSDEQVRAVAGPGARAGGRKGGVGRGGRRPPRRRVRNSITRSSPRRWRRAMLMAAR